ncbi:MAG TPA: tetratricopeptide repeat protein [Vicinamibacterales bacterium]|nr:tetratricopeptide repeat protein [Vicinamibacterales bacterium]
MADNPRIEDLRRRIEKDPASIAFAQLAEEYRRAGQHQNAIDTCRAGLDRHPGYLSARVTLGRALIELGQPDEAQHELELVLKSAPENLAAIRGLGEIHQGRGALAEALTYYKAALALARNDPDLEETIADLTKQTAPPKPPKPEPETGVSFDDIHEALLRQADLREKERAQTPPPQPLPPAVVPEQATMLESPEPPAEPLANETQDQTPSRAGQTVAALEQWLDALHVTRTQSGS